MVILQFAFKVKYTFIIELIKQNEKYEFFIAHYQLCSSIYIQKKGWYALKEQMEKKLDMSFRNDWEN